MWSPEWSFDDETFARSAVAFDNPDFVEVVIHSYRHRYGLVPGDPGVAHIETRLTARPPIGVPAVTVDGAADGVSGTTQHHARHFTGPHRHHIWPGAGHNLPQERPRDWADVVIEALALAEAGPAAV
jgi:pimeloyl-ACP methyl ester carboxylesterase